MPDITQCKQWLDEARPLLGIMDGRKMGKRTAEISDLLKNMEKILASDPPEYQVLKSKSGHTEFQKTFDKLAREFEILANDADGTNDKSDVKLIAARLRNLKQEARLGLGKAKPTGTTKVKNQILNSARNEPIYRDREKQFYLALNQLQSVPGTKRQQQEITELLKRAEQLLPDYNKAVRALTLFSDLNVMQGEGLKLLMQDAEKESSELPEKLFPQSPEFAEAYRNAEKLLRDYIENAPLSDSETVNFYRDELPTILGDAETKGKPKIAIRAIRKAVKELTQLLQQCKTSQGLIEKPKKKVENKWAEMQKSVPLDTFALLKQERERAESLESCQLYDQAASAYTALGRKIDQALVATGEAPNKWNGMQQEITEMEKTVQEAEGVPELSTVMNELRSTILQARTEVKMNQNFLLACKEITGIREDIKALKKATKTFTENDGNTPPTAIFPDDHRTVDVKMLGLITTVENLVREVKNKEIAKLIQEGGDPTPFYAKCDLSIEAVNMAVKHNRKWFEHNYAKAKGKKMRQEVVKGLINYVDKDYKGPVVQDARDLRKAVNKVLNDDRLLKESRGKNILVKNKERSLAAIKEVEEAIRKFEVLQLPSEHPAAVMIKKFRQNLKDLTQKANQGKNIAEVAEGHTEDLNKELLKLEGEIDSRTQEAEKRAKAVEDKITKLEKDDPKYTAYFTSLRVEVGVAASKWSSRVSKVSAQGEDSLKDIEQKIDDLKISMKDNSQNYTAVDNMAKELKKDVAEVKKLDRKTHAMLEHQFDVLLPEVQKLHPDKALEKLKEFKDGKLKTAHDRATDLAKQLELFKKAATKFKNDLNKTKLAKDAPALYKSLMARREAAKGAAAGNLDFARNELASMQLLMDVAAEDEEKAAKLNVNAEEEEFAEKRRKQEYNAAKDLFNTTYKQRAVLASGDRPDEYSAMKRLIAQGDKAANRNPPDFVTARENLDKAIDMAKFLIENPDDDSSPRGRDLKKLNQSWKNRVGEYLKQVSNLASLLDSSTDDEGDDLDTDMIHDWLDPLLSLFDPKAFDKQIEVLARSKPKPEINAHRKTKEEVLVRIRRFQTKLKVNATLKHVAGNPVSNVIVRPLRDTLNGLEAEVLGS